eukprot:SAG31_NODE_3530_length_4152_cov_1.164569_2_plen_82_part_00
MLGVTGIAAEECDRADTQLRLARDKDRSSRAYEYNTLRNFIKLRTVPYLGTYELLNLVCWQLSYVGTDVNSTDLPLLNLST